MSETRNCVLNFLVSKYLILNFHNDVNHQLKIAFVLFVRFYIQNKKLRNKKLRLEFLMIDTISKFKQ
jgi:hypothetical protein